MTNPKAPEAVNEHGQFTDELILKKARIKISLAACVGTLLNSLGPNLSTMVIRMFGGNDFHLGIAGAFGNLGQVLQFMGSVVLKFTKSNKKGYLVGAIPGIAIGLLSAFFIFNANASWKGLAFAGYLAMILGAALTGAVTGNIYVSWIGDLVPREKLGWFFSLKWITVNIAAIIGSVGLAKVADIYPTPGGYALISMGTWLAGVIGLLIFLTVPDREPKCTNFFVAGNCSEDRVQYKSRALWCYVAFYVIWASGRTLLATFTPIFLIEKFHFSMSNLAWLGTLQLAVSSIVIYLLGKVSDKKGSRPILMLTSGFVALCMFLWVGSAWWGIAPIIIYTILNGAAGQTHSMLAVNYGIEIFPDKGRSAYLAFARFFIGIASMVAPFFAGWVMSSFKNIHLTVSNVVLDRYYLCFLAGAILTCTCVIPLLIAGKRKVGD